VQAFLELDLGSRVRFIGVAEATFTGDEPSREDGSPSLGFADEAEASAGLAFGERHRDWRTRWSDGTYVGLFAREQAGERMLGVTVAIAINGASE
jgi:hypothetical protein